MVKLNGQTPAQSPVSTGDFSLVWAARFDKPDMARMRELFNIPAVGNAISQGFGVYRQMLLQQAILLEKLYEPIYDDYEQVAQEWLDSRVNFITASETVQAKIHAYQQFLRTNRINNPEKLAQNATEDLLNRKSAHEAAISKAREDAANAFKAITETPSYEDEE